MELIWAILVAAGKVVPVEALVGSAIGGIVGNRIDAGFMPLDQVFADSGNVSPFENICLQELMTAWDVQVIRSFIASRLGNGRVQFSSGQIDRIVQETGGNPGKVMRACFELYRQSRSLVE